MMKTRTTASFTLLVWLSTFTCGLNAFSAFWQQVSPNEFSKRFTTEMLMVYSGIDVKQCKKQINETPKIFVKNYDRQIQAVTEIINEKFQLLFDELLEQTKTPENDLKKNTLKKYMKWLDATMKRLHKIGNFSGAATIAYALSISLDYDITTGKVFNKNIGINTNEVIKLFAKFIPHKQSQSYERKMQSSGTYFFPNVITLRKELESLAGDDITYSQEQREWLAESICKKLSRESFSRYKQHLINSPGTW